MELVPSQPALEPGLADSAAQSDLPRVGTIANSEVADNNYVNLQIKDREYNVHRETMAKKRAAFLLTQRVTFDWLIRHGLITKGAWLVLNQTVDLKYDRCHESVACLLYTSPSPRDRTRSRMPSSA
eukprot:TRINITY_DN7322_c0_g1_i2.p1 TRINITY_DN7322_c0_g1~~TRINITY_DN7322_c0_g1_i2.p1  ORF type:complete len:126 (-),score=34.98 TRINITY_DN7322_c0_g1_i2:41-418(-)